MLKIEFGDAQALVRGIKGGVQEKYVT